jgi:hypothetical protein
LDQNSVHKIESGTPSSTDVEGHSECPRFLSKAST